MFELAVSVDVVTVCIYEFQVRRIDVRADGTVAATWRSMPLRSAPDVTGGCRRARRSVPERHWFDWSGRNAQRSRITSTAETQEESPRPSLIETPLIKSERLLRRR